MSDPLMFELTALPEAYAALIEGRRRAHILTRTIGCPEPGQAVRVAEVGEHCTRTGRCCFARVTYVETFDAGPPIGPVYVLSLDVRMSSDRMPAVT